LTTSTWTVSWSPPTPCTPNGKPPGTWSKHRAADYVFTVKGNQRTLLVACQLVLSGPTNEFAAEHVERHRGHGRTEQRTTRVATVTVKSGIREIAYCITSLTTEQASPERLAAYPRGHWAIENRLHWGPRQRLRRGPLPDQHRRGPHVKASRRSLSVGALHQHRRTNIAAGLPWASRGHARALNILGITSLAETLHQPPRRPRRHHPQVRTKLSQVGSRERRTVYQCSFKRHTTPATMKSNRLVKHPG
jgi:hypothetical protein